SLLLLSFAAGRCVVLLNADWLLQLQWRPAEAELQTTSCCSVGLTDGGRQTAADRCICGETLFVLHTTGLISVCSCSDGALLASIDLLAYLNSWLVDDDLSLPSSSFSSASFCLLQVSPDLSTAVAVTRCHAAVAVDLNHYFRKFPGHLLCAVPASRPPLQTQHDDQDSVCSSSRSFVRLGWNLRPDRSWEAHLASLYSSAQQSPTRLRSRPTAEFLPAVPRRRFPSPTRPWRLCAVSEFSAQLTFVSPGNQPNTAALWDLESGRLSYHQTWGPAAPVQRCGEKQHRLFLKKAGLFQVLFSISQQDLLLRLMLFGSAATVDAVCHLNSWGRCSIPIHSLQAGLKNRQLDTVDFYLKSKENVLRAADLSDGSRTGRWSRRCLQEAVLTRLQQLRPALDLLCSAVRDSHSEAQSRPFSEQLLSITVSFIHTQIRTILSSTHSEDPGVRSCVDVLGGYVTQLRSYMKKLPWPAGGDTCSSADALGEGQEDEWACLQTEELVRLSVLTNQIPRAQAVLRRRGCAEQRLRALRTEGLRQAFSCLQRRDLQSACALLANMGFSVKEQLRRICLYTDDKDLRQFTVKVLSERGLLPEEEKQSVAFIGEMEKLGLLPPSRHAAPRPHRFLQVTSRGPPPGLELLTRSEDRGSLWRSLRLDWVRNWDRSCQTAIVLSRLQHSALDSCESTVLWRYLTSLHDQRVLGWMGWVGGGAQASSAPRWPELAPEVVNSNTMCSTYMRENILDLLARRRVFVPDELADLEQLLWRLAQGGGVMGSSSPIPQYRSPLCRDFHSVFIAFCQDHNLQYLLYTYLEHHRLTPRNCPPLADQRAPESQPWCEMLVKVQEVTRDLTDPGLVFQASLTGAQVLLPDSQASLVSLLLEGHSLLALATIMFAPGGINQVSSSRAPAPSRSQVDPQVLKMALAPYPRLKAALFPGGPRGHGSSDVTLYHLLQALHPLDPSRLFGWQAANAFSSTEASELPHFSSPPLVSRFALVENLDFLFYLRHGRPAFAFATFLTQQLSGCAHVSLQLQQVRQQVYRLALQCFDVAPVVSACVCFCELLGVCSLTLRVDVRALNAILQHRSRQHAAGTPARHLRALVSKGVKLVEAEPEAAEELIGQLEAAVTDQLDQRGVARSSIEAAQEWALPVQFCQLHRRTLSSVYPAHCATGRLIHFLLFVQLHNFPPQQVVRALAAGFGPTLQAHLSLAFQDLQVCHERRGCGSEGAAAAPRSTQGSTELFQVLLRSLEEAEPCRFLLREALLQRSPTLAVMAACQQGAEHLACLCVWVLTSVDDVTASEATSHLDEGAEHHQWTLHDLSAIWRTLLGRGCVRPLLRGFELFQRECPLVLVLRMFELCCDYRNFSEAKLKLLDFQKSLLTLRTSGPACSGGLPLQWVESQASVLLLTLLQRCSSQYDLHRLLQLLADVDKLKSNGPDFRKLSQLSGLLRDSDLGLPPGLLQCTSPSVQQGELQAVVEALQARGRYSQARQVALLAGLSVQQLLLSQLVQEADAQRSKRQWGRLETRVAFWKRCHQRLKGDGADPEAAFGFFQAQVEPGGRSEAEELLDVQERSLLLCLAAHWLSQLSPAPVGQLESLEKQLWLLRVRRHVLAVHLEKASVFRLPPPSVTPGSSRYEALMEEFSVAKLSCLRTEARLRLDGLPGPSDRASGLSPEEAGVLSALIGQLLDEGGVHEASRASRYFCLHHPDLWLVLRCRGLAAGDLKPEEAEEAEEAAPESSIKPCKPRPQPLPVSAAASASSLLSFSMLALPDDGVAARLQKLVDQCHHGNAYCRQVLGLHQLSKELQCSFSQICSQEPASVLEQLLLSEQPDRFRAQTFIRAQGLGPDAVAELVSSALVQALTPSSQDLQPERQQVFRPSEGRDSLLQLMQLCEDPNLVGSKLLEALGGVPLRELACVVELLIVAHDCFSLTCNMEGIVRVLQAARHLSHAHLAPGEHFSLLVRLLTGIGRYAEMTYVDLLHQHHRFEMLLRKKVDASSGLKAALLDYLRRRLPADSEKHNMVALCFSMRREIGNHEVAARTQLKMIQSQAWVVTPELKSSLVKVLSLLKDAAESFSKDACVRQATRCARTAKLVALQLHLLDRDSDLRVINLSPAELPAAIMSLARCYQVLVVSEAYGYTPDWAGVLYHKVVLDGDFAFLEELKRRRPLTSSLFEDIFQKYELEGAPSSSAPNVKRLLTHCEDVHVRYRLAYQQKLFDVTKTLLEDATTSSYLSDRAAS
uniref:SPG11 vesicle trafficking associated, spatacsin n=1 Tax=Tetraodon nigroviridis TaxID=99883 RepID=H3CAS0_TETNG